MLIESLCKKTQSGHHLEVTYGGTPILSESIDGNGGLGRVAHEKFDELMQNSEISDFVTKARKPLNSRIQSIGEATTDGKMISNGPKLARASFSWCSLL